MPQADHHSSRQLLLRVTLVAAVLSTGAQLALPEQYPKISETIARRLVRLALAATEKAGEPFNIETIALPWAPEFMTYSGYRPGPLQDDGSSVLESHYFAVNPWTGDVWESIGCILITSSAIEKEQKAILARSKFSPQVLKSLRERSLAGRRNYCPWQK